MKNTTCILLLCMVVTVIHAQNTGIGTTNPQTILEVATDGSLLNGVRISNTGATVGPALTLWGSRAYTIYSTNSAGGSGVNKFIIRDYSMGENRLVIDPLGSIGINTDNPTALLDVNGTIRIRGGSPGAGKILTANAIGLASWNSLPAATASFRIGKPTDQSMTSGLNAQVLFSSEIYNDGNNFGLNSFTAPADGLYHFDIKEMWNLTAVAGQYNIIIGLLLGPSATELSRSQYRILPGINGSMSTDLSVEVKLTTGQFVFVSGYQDSGINQQIGSTFSYFSGHRVY
jgi:hypothetical protein